MNTIEFLRHPAPEHPRASVWAVRVDGVDLRRRVADATRALWHPELADQFDDQEREEEELLLTQHAGLPAAEFAPAHFLTPADTAPVLGCPCGIWDCWPLLAHIGTTPESITWTAFRQPHRPQWGTLPLGPFTFARTPYERALATAPTVARDPLEDEDPASRP
ncbi:hypothetical protein [Streptomyces longwoodensis]|uniref:hypothetical protein n=1 Tax=Streptomyces longwoodensis TaxID=68231 RepID=UPI0033E78870